MIIHKYGSLEHDTILQYGHIEEICREERKSGSDYVTAVIHVTEIPVVHLPPSYDAVGMPQCLGTWFLGEHDFINNRCYSVKEEIHNGELDFFKAREITIISYEIDYD